MDDDFLRSIEEAKRFHASSKAYSGKLLRPHAPYIKEIINRLGCKTVLDYGAGKGQQYEWVMPMHGMTIEEWWGVPVTKYDPAWPPFSAEPQGDFDLVICTYTLGAIPTASLVSVINRLFSFSHKAIYIAERIGQSKKQVYSRPELYPVGWNVEQWKARLWRASGIELTLAVKERNQEGMISDYWRLIEGEWLPVLWPADIRALNHQWA